MGRGGGESGRTVIAGTGGATVEATDFAGARRVTLANGARGYAIPVPTVRSAIVKISVRAGGRDERTGELGAAHLLEHLLFKGSARFPTHVDTVAPIERIGGMVNASTGFETTQFYAVLPARSWRTAFDIVVDQLRAPLLRPADLERERGVVIEEMRGYADDPGEQASELLQEMLYPGDRLGLPVIGTLEDLRAISTADLRAFYERAYTPDRIVATVAGNVDADEVTSMLVEALGPIGGARDSLWPVPGPGQRGVTRLREGNGDQVALEIGWRTVGDRDEDRTDQLALVLAGGLLSGGMSSRLFIELREKRGLVYGVSAGQSRGSEDHGVFGLTLALAPERALEAREVAMAQIERLASERIPDEELAQLKDRLTGQVELSLDQPPALAAWCASNEFRFGRVRSVEEALAQLAAVTAEDIMSAVRRYLDPANACTAIVGPRAALESYGLGDIEPSSLLSLRAAARA